MIAGVRSQFAGLLDARVVKGIGDDCAVFSQMGDTLSLVTMDTLVESVHFDCSWHPAGLLGRKCAAVNISDIAAMGGEPRFALLSLAVPSTIGEDWLREFFSGFHAVLHEHRTALIGGDTVRCGREMVFSICVLGEVGRNEILYRSGAREGDVIWVSGPLGEAGAGLALCRLGIAAEDPDWSGLVAAHLDPKPLAALGAALGQSGMVHAMIDLSDGLATDLSHLCTESGLGAEIHADRIPLSSALQRAARRCEVSPLTWALRAGEDYQLLWTSAPDQAEKLQRLIETRLGVRMIDIGRIVASPGVFLLENGQRQDMSYQGYDHFA